jgi:hypothetical protein
MDHGKSFLSSLTAEVDSSETIFVSSVHPGSVPAPLRLFDLFSIASHAVSAPRTDSAAASVSAHRNPTMNESAIVRLTPVQRPAIFRLCADRNHAHAQAAGLSDHCWTLRELIAYNLAITSKSNHGS